MSHQCWECGAEFASPSELVFHRRQNHAEEFRADALAAANGRPRRNYRCAVCGMRFTSPDRLALHNLDPGSHARRPVGRASIG